MSRAPNELTIRQATELVTLVENQLGWNPQPRRGMPPSKVKDLEARKLALEAAKDPRYTYPHLQAAIYYLHRQEKTVRFPWAVTYYVEKAIADVEPEVTTPVGDRIDAAIAQERSLEHPGWETWTSRLTRCTGQFRTAVLEEWELERGHLWNR